MASALSKIAVMTHRKLHWLSQVKDFDVNLIPDTTLDFSFLDEEQYYLLLIDDETLDVDVKSIVIEIQRTQPLVSVVLLTANPDPNYALEFLELNIADVLNVNDDAAFLTRRLKLAFQQNQSKRATIRNSRNLNAVTVLSRRLHNANHPTTLIVDALELVSRTFNLMGLVIVLEGGRQYHLRAGGSSINSNRRVYDVMTDLHSYSPLYQVIDKGLVMVFEDLSLNPYMVDIPIFDKLHSAIALPLRYANITLGALMVLGLESNPLTRDDIVIYEHLATHLGSAYQNVRHSYTQDVSARTNLHLLRTWQQLSKAYSTQGVDEIIISLALDISLVKHALVWLYDDTTGDPIVIASNSESQRVFHRLYAVDIINDYVNQFDTQLRPLITWLGRSNSRNIGDLFLAMEGQQLIFVPIKDEARLWGCIIVSSTSNEEMNNEYISLLEGIAHAVGQTLARNLLISHKDSQTERLEAITRSIKDGVFFVADRQDVVFCNPQFTELTGISPSLVLNNSVQSLLEELIERSDNPNQIRQQLDHAINQLQSDSIDGEYPIVEINIPSIESKLYAEFIALPGKNSDDKSWIGILRNREYMVSSSDELSPRIIAPTINYLRGAVNNMQRDLDAIDTAKQDSQLHQIKSQSQDIEQSLSNIKYLVELNQNDNVQRSWADPEAILTDILSTSPVVQYSRRLDVQTSLKNTNIQVNVPYLTQALINLIDVAIQLSDVNTSIPIQMGIQANRLIFRVISDGFVMSPKQIEQILIAPDASLDDIPYDVQLKLYAGNQMIQSHEGQLIIKKAVSSGMQFNFLLPLGDSVEQDVDIDKELGSIPERKLSTLMIYDDNQSQGDVDYDSLEDEEYELIYCDTLEQVYNEIEMVRIDLIIITVRENHDRVIKFVERIRQQKKVTTPILMLSTYNEEKIRIQALRSGVDAYIGLPISQAELLAQIDSIFERGKLPERVHEPLTTGKLRIDFAQRQVTLDGKSVNLTRIEYDLLCHLALKMGQTLTHGELLTEVWGPEYRDEKNYLWVNMSRLRGKLEKTPDKTRYIFTQPGVGYILKQL